MLFYYELICSKVFRLNYERRFGKNARNKFDNVEGMSVGR